MYAIDRVRGIVRSWLKQVARLINGLSGGRVTPNQITALSVLGHGLIAWAIYDGRLTWAAAGLVIFGLMDALDGELARLQKRDSNLGIIFDSVADRIKETLIYSGIIANLAPQHSPVALMWVILALGLSISLSYIKAKGEAVLASQSDVKIDPQALNRFTGGDTLMQFDVRMAFIVIGLVFNVLWWVVIVITVMSSFSISSRYIELKHLLKK